MKNFGNETENFSHPIENTELDSVENNHVSCTFFYNISLYIKTAS